MKILYFRVQNFITRLMNGMVHKQFKPGDIIRMNPAKRSYVKRPYYVLCVSFNENAEWGRTLMEIMIPEYHTVNIILGQNDDYHMPRMKKVGTIVTHKHLLFNQNLT